MLLGYVFGFRLPDVFLKTDNLTRENDINVVKINSDISGTKQKRKKLDFENMKISLETYLNAEHPLPMIEVAEKIGVNKRIILRYFPDLCKQISKRYKEHLSNKSNQRKVHLCHIIEDVIERLIKDNEYPSRRKIELNLPDGIILKDSRFKSIWKSKLEEYGL